MFDISIMNISVVKTLWEERYKSSLVQQADYLLEVYRYIELNSRHSENLS
jgi:hypothetical protein